MIQSGRIQGKNKIIKPIKKSSTLEQCMFHVKKVRLSNAAGLYERKTSFCFLLWLGNSCFDSFYNIVNNISIFSPIY